jgi:tripartite-type tricarboxylate transporter receptor subunit TctC
MTSLVARLVLMVALIAPAFVPSSAADPGKTVRMIVPFPPGGATDAIARILQPKMQEVLGASVVIENKGGAGGSLGTELVAKAPSDGYTVLFTFSSHTINPALYPKLAFDAVKDFEPVGLAATLPQILVVHPRLPMRSVAELLAAAKAEPGSLAYASAGNGSAGHLAGELMKHRTGIQMTHVPYRGGGPAISDVVGGQVPLMWVSIAAVAQHIRQGLLRPLAVSTLKRSVAFPDVPTMAESGVPDFQVDSWCAVFVPVGTPRAAVDRLNTALNLALGNADVRARLLAQGAEPAGGTSEALGKVVAVELPKWASLVREMRIKAD